MQPSRKVPGIKNYEFIHVDGKNCLLGFGAYGSVQVGKNTATGQTVAIKRINRKMAFSEVQVHMKLLHHNIIKMMDYSFDEKNQCTYIVLEYAENGTLFDYIKNNGIKDKRMAKGIFLSVCDALDYLHGKNIMHRDIKVRDLFTQPENILLNNKNQVKVCDFGFAVGCEPRMTVCGTPEYMAPEMIMGKQYNHKIDIWCIGILMYEMIEGRAPFEGNSPCQVFEKMKKPVQFSANFDQEEKDLIKSILRINPNDRPEIREILKSQYFKNLREADETSNRSTTEQEQEKKIKIVDIKDFHKEKAEEKRIKIIEIKNLQPERIFQLEKNNQIEKICQPEKIFMKGSIIDKNPQIVDMQELKMMNHSQFIESSVKQSKGDKVGSNAGKISLRSRKFSEFTKK